MKKAFIHNPLLSKPRQNRNCLQSSIFNPAVEFDKV